MLQIDTKNGRVQRFRGYYTGRGFVDWLEMGSDMPLLNETEEDREMARDAMMAMVQGAVMTVMPTATEEETEDEEEARDYYRRAAELTGNPHTRQMLLNLSDMEQDHADQLRKELEELILQRGLEAGMAD